MWRTQMTSPMPRSPINPDPLVQRDNPVLDILPFGMLVFCVLLSLSVGKAGQGAEVAGIIGGGVAAAWMLGVYQLRPAWRYRPRVMAVFITVVVVLGALL